MDKQTRNTRPLCVRAVIYSRVSTDAQERDGTSLDTQERACLDFAQKAGWRVVECTRDAASGFTLDRPGVERLRQLLRQGAADVALAYAVDRLSRNQNHIGVLFDEVEQAGARLEFVTEKFEDTAIGRFILSARAFVGEVEREKIAERTMRGKAERARSGRIPQGTGKGCYGYTYEPGSGHRKVDAFQAEVVRRIFQRYGATRSYSAVAYELNQAKVPSLGGGRWYSLTIRRVLLNESYTGRLFYRRTQKVKSWSARLGKSRSRVVGRPREDWIEVPQACPRIVDQAQWERVQAILADPERTRCQPTTNFYELRGHAKCGVCGAAMVGQTLKTGGRSYRYYRCRHIYDRTLSYGCTARYVQAQPLEDSVWSEVRKVLSTPDVVLQELAAQRENASDAAEIGRLEGEIGSIAERERRLVRLYSQGTVSEDAIRDESERLARERALLQEHLASLSGSTHANAPLPDRKQLEAICAAVSGWLEQAGDDDRVLALEALQVAVRATKDSATISGVLPAEPPGVLSQANGHAHVCAVVRACRMC